MAKFRSLTIARLKSLVETTIAGFQDGNVSNGRIVQAALSDAREICVGDYDTVICAALSPLVRQALAKGAIPAYAAAPTLIPGLKLPYRIAVPPPEMAVDPDEAGEEAAETTWIVLHKATIAEGRRHVAMRDAHIAGAQTERDKISAVVDMAAALTKDEEAVIGEVLGRRAA
jgi:hypothetical protein